MKIAFLGLGDIGKPMADHLAREPFELTVWNRTAAKADDFVRVHNGKKVRAAKTPANAVTGSDVVITCLPSSVEVEELLHREDGILAGISSGALFLDCTSGDPTASIDIAAELATRGIQFVDAPVSGGTIAAIEGRLTVMCGGERTAFDRVMPVLEAFGKKIVYCGPVGAGHTVKAVNQALLAVHILATAEALVTAAKAGVTPHIPTRFARQGYRHRRSAGEGDGGGGAAHRTRRATHDRGAQDARGGGGPCRSSSPGRTSRRGGNKRAGVTVTRRKGAPPSSAPVIFPL